MTGGAFFGSGLVEEHSLTVQHSYQLVAGFALHIPVRPLQGERGALVVIEQGWLPFRTVVAIGAGRDWPFGKLPAVHIFVTVFALR